MNNGEDPPPYSAEEPLLQNGDAHSGVIQATEYHRTPTKSSFVIQTYRWRWVVLLIFSLNLAMTNIIWIPSAPIANVVICYYDISLFWVNALSEVYMLVYIPLLFPVVWMLDKYGLKLSLMIGACSDAAGAALKLAGTGNVCVSTARVCVCVCGGG